ISDRSVALSGRPGDRVEYGLTVTAREKRSAVAYAVSDRPWLTVGRTVHKGQTATIPLTVTMVPHEPGATLTATVKVTANGNQRFDVPVTLNVAEEPGTFAQSSVVPLDAGESLGPLSLPSVFASAPPVVEAAPTPAP